MDEFSNLFVSLIDQPIVSGLIVTVLGGIIVGYALRARSNNIVQPSVVVPSSNYPPSNSNDLREKYDFEELNRILDLQYISARAEALNFSYIMMLISSVFIILFGFFISMIEKSLMQFAIFFLISIILGGYSLFQSDKYLKKFRSSQRDLVILMAKYPAFQGRIL